MEKNEIQAAEVERTMTSLDGIQRAEPGPWFLTRLQGRILAQRKSAWISVGSFLSRPVVAFSAIVMILVLNVVLLVNEQIEKPVSVATPGSTATENEYITATNNSFYYENPVQP